MTSLDRPIWSALTTRQTCFAEGDRLAVRLRRDMGVFATTRDWSAEAIAALVALAPDEGSLAVFEPDPLPPMPGLRVNEARVMCQMVDEGGAEPVRGDESAIIGLGDADASDMLALAQLTRPGPFASRTPEFGGFVGLREAGALIAMAGTRLSAPGWREVSAVCTHPDHRGRGLAALLMRRVARAIRAAGDMPILHSFADNLGAIALYERLGYRTRRHLTVTFLQRE